MTSSVRGLQRHPAVGSPANQRSLTRPIVTPQPHRLRGTWEDLRLALVEDCRPSIIQLAALLSVEASVACRFSQHERQKGWAQRPADTTTTKSRPHRWMAAFSLNMSTGGDKI